MDIVGLVEEESREHEGGENAEEAVQWLPDRKRGRP